MTTRRWVDAVNILLGLWLIAAPSLTSAAGDGPAAWNSWSVGIAVLTLTAFAMYKPSVSADALGVLLGVWLIASPWVLGFVELPATTTEAVLPAAATNAVLVGVLVIGYALWAMRIDGNAARTKIPRGGYVSTFRKAQI